MAHSNRSLHGRQPKSRSNLALLALLLLGLMACRSGAHDAELAAEPLEPAGEAAAPVAAVPEAPDESAAVDTARGANGVVVDARLLEWRIELSRDSVSPGRTVFQVSNVGTHRHEFEIEGPGVDSEVYVNPGATARLELDLQPGTYEIVCSIRRNGIDHEAQGMRTTLTVR